MYLEVYFGCSHSVIYSVCKVKGTKKKKKRRDRKRKKQHYRTILADDAR